MNREMIKWDFSFLTRKKIVNEETLAHTKLHRVMGVLDVTAIGKFTKYMYFFFLIKLKAISNILIQVFHRHWVQEFMFSLVQLLPSIPVLRLFFHLFSLV